jgi:phosphoribosylformylglycinamidine synthase
MLGGHKGRNVPAVDTTSALALYRALHGAMREGLVASCHDCSEGGIAVAAAESAFAGGLGMRIDISQAPALGELPDEVLLFSESNSRFVVTVSRDNRAAFEAALAGNALAVGEVTGDNKLTITGADGAILIDAGNDELKEAWQAPLRW